MFRTGRIGVAVMISAVSGILGWAGARALEIRLEEPDAGGPASARSVAGAAGAIPLLSASLAPTFRADEAGAPSPPRWGLGPARAGSTGGASGSVEGELRPREDAPGSLGSDLAGDVPGGPASRASTEAGPGSRPQAWDAPGAAPLPLRLVDAGAVGIDPDPASWQGSYSHGTGAFHALIDPRTAQVDEDAVRRIRGEWATHVERMAGFGNNAVAVGAFLELMTFEGAGVYAPDSPYPARHAGLRVVFGELFATARRSGLAPYLRTDMLALTPPLERALRERTGGTLDTTDPALWSLYAEGLEELFQTLPEVEGVVIRIGEAGALYNREDWPYASRMGVQEPEQLRAMLKGLLPTFERHGKTLVLRSWSVGLGELGHMHTDPAVYARVLGGIRSPNLVVSTKYTRGDYFGFLPLNPTLASGGHRRLVEFQARREFEGFTAFPNFLGDEHGEALRALTAANPDIEGIYLWSQEGGPLHAGPRSLYPLHGFWSWIDANAWATSRLAQDPSLEGETLAAGWVRETVSRDPRVVEGLTDVLLRSREAVEKGLYVRPFAESAIRTAGVEVPPMMWIMEWDVVGDWRAVSSTLYRASRGELQSTVDEGFEAVDEVRAMRASLERAAAGLVGDPRLPAMRRSLEYQESLFTTLAWWRSALLSYYGWLAQGDEGLRRQYAGSAEQVRGAAADHLARFGDDLDFPAYDFTPALKALDRHDRNLLARDASRVLLLVWLLAGGAAVAMTEIRRRRAGPGGLDRVASTAPPGRSRGTFAAFALLPLTAATLWMLMAFEGEQAVLALLAMLVAFSAVLGRTGTGSFQASSVGQGRGSANGADARLRPSVGAALWPLLAVVLPPLALMAVRGPDLVWFLFWGDLESRALLLALIPATVLGMGAAAVQAGAARKHLPTDVLWGRLLLATGTVLVLLGIALPDLATLLSTLDDPLSFLPMRLALIVAVTAYAGVPTWITMVPGTVGGVSLLLGLALLRRNRNGNRRTRRGWSRRVRLPLHGSSAIRPEPRPHPGPSAVDVRWPG